MEEVAVHGTDPWLAVRRDGGDGEDLHPRQEGDDLCGAERAVGVDDAAEVVGGTGMGGVEQALETGQLLGCLEHPLTVDAGDRRPT